MMREPVRIPGWSDEQWRDYEVGWRRADARVSEILEAPLASSPSPSPAGLVPDESEFRARELIVQSDRADVVAREKQIADIRIAGIELPGQPPSPQEVRERLLEQAMASGTVVIRPGDGPPKADFVVTTPEGSVQVTKRQAMPQMTVITPDNAAEVDRRFGSLRREEENKLLINRFGEKPLRKAGIIP